MHMEHTYWGYRSKYNIQLFLSCWVAYFSTYICRLNFSVVMPELNKNGILSETQMAAVSSAFFICYGIGQLFSGRLGDQYSPRIMVFIGTSVSALSNIGIFFFHTSYTALLLLWAINGIVQSLVWSPILRIAGDYFDNREKEKFGSDISTTVPLGTLASYGVSLITLMLLPWHYTFLTCGICTLTASLFWINETKKLHLYKNEDADKNQSSSKRTEISWKDFIKISSAAGIFILFIPIAIQGTLKDSVTQWLPTLFEDCFQLGTDNSILFTMILPIVNVIGAYLSKALNKHIRNELKTSAFFFAISMFFLILLLFSGLKNSLLALLCIAVITTCMYAINVMLITMVPLYFNQYGCVSTMGGLLNASAYIGCGLLNLAAGKVLKNEAASWNTLFIFWLLLCIIAILFTCICAVIWNKFKIKQTT